MKTAVIIGDLQIPFQDQKVVDWVIKFTQLMRPDMVILNGDVVDCYAISAFDKNPLTTTSLLDEITQGRRVMEALEEVPVKWWLGGNHEDRLRRYIWRNAPALGVLPELDFPTLFHLKDHGFRWKPYGEVLKVGKLAVTHGDVVRKHSGETARAHFESFGCSVIVNHTHRLGAYYRTRLGKPYVAYENGCLCRLDPEYAHNPNWQQGFSVVHVNEKTGEFNVQQVQIFRRRGRVTFYYGREQFYS